MIDAPPSAGDPIAVLRSWRRHPADRVRFVFATAILIASIGLVEGFPDTMNGVTQDLRNLFERIPETVREPLTGIVQVFAALLPLIIAVVLVVRRQFVVIGVVALGAATASFLQSLLDDVLERAFGSLDTDLESWISDLGFPSGAYMAALAGGATLLAPHLSRSWRRAVIATIAALALARTVSDVAAVPFSFVPELALGVAVGAGITAIIGAPARWLTHSAIIATLEGAGLLVSHLVEFEPGRHRTRLLTAQCGDTEVFVKITGTDQRDADFGIRILRRLRLKGVDDNRSGWRAIAAVEHEAFVGLAARSGGAPAPEFRALAEGADGTALLVTDAIDGMRLADLDTVDDSTLDAIWQGLDRYHHAGIAHGWASARHIVITPSSATGAAQSATAPTAHFVDHHWAMLPGDTTSMALDIANLAVSLATIVGPQRAVASCRGIIDRDRLAAALPLVQSPVLSRDLKRVPDSTLDEVRDAIQQSTGLDEIELADVRRVTATSMLALVAVGFVVYATIVSLSKWSSIEEAFRTANWWMSPIALAFAAAVYPAMAVSLLGSTATRLAFTTTTAVMLAQSFPNHFTPANAGGIALRTRFLQRRGLDIAAAASSVGLTSLAAALAQFVLIAIFALWSRQSATLGSPSRTDLEVAAAALLIVLVAAGIIYFSAWGRRVVVAHLRNAMRSIRANLGAVARDPKRLAMLLGGGLALRLTMLCTFVIACQMADITTGIAQLGLLYLVANTVASAAPTPGGLGAVEAALLLALSGAGVASQDAITAIFVYRLATYWLPIAPGWLTLRAVRRRSLL